jgi:hypothetical protein
MKLIRFIGGGDGVTDDPSVLHLDAADGTDYTLCGITLDGDDETAGEFEFVIAPAVTCSCCVAIIKHCRGVRIAPPNAKLTGRGLKAEL